MRNLCIRI